MAISQEARLAHSAGLQSWNARMDKAGGDTLWNYTTKAGAMSVQLVADFATKDIGPLLAEASTELQAAVAAQKDLTPYINGTNEYGADDAEIASLIAKRRVKAAARGMAASADMIQAVARVIVAGYANTLTSPANIIAAIEAKLPAVATEMGITLPK